ncbi:MAG: hypothetical protein KGM39_04440, partial [Actinomycetales bacterium]|nr:hypothetical protein [Actinomycetales bacterium]
MLNSPLSLKAMGVLEPTGKRGEWRLSADHTDKLPKIQNGKVLLAFATDLGVALWGSCIDVFGRGLDGDSISLCLTSPPYPLAVPRAYGNPAESEYVDWLCTALEPIAKHLKPGGSICLNVSNDIFLSQSPARSLYRERLVLALHDRLGLYKMDELIWSSNKAPGPVRYASITRQHLNVAYEPIYWFTNDPAKCTSNNRRVLLPHTKAHARYMHSGQREN